MKYYVQIVFCGDEADFALLIFAPLRIGHRVIDRTKTRLAPTSRGKNDSLL